MGPTCDIWSHRTVSGLERDQSYTRHVGGQFNEFFLSLLISMTLVRRSSKPLQADVWDKIARIRPDTWLLVFASNSAAGAHVDTLIMNNCGDEATLPRRPGRACSPAQQIFISAAQSQHFSVLAVCPPDAASSPSVHLHFSHQEVLCVTPPKSSLSAAEERQE